eukprot:Skav212474  [mRNA]  locus=scaffold385:369792:372669:- [translate_table: standard]
MLSPVLWMTFGWLVFYLCQWLLWNFTADDGNGAHHTSKLIAANSLALMGSVLVFFPMVCGHVLKQSRWMTSPTFVNVYTAVQGASETLEGETKQKAFAMVDIIIMLAVILPGWYLYMLPFAQAEAKEEPEAKDASEAPEDKSTEARHGTAWHGGMARRDPSFPTVGWLSSARVALPGLDGLMSLWLLRSRVLRHLQKPWMPCLRQSLGALRLGHFLKSYHVELQ